MGITGRAVLELLILYYPHFCLSDFLYKRTVVFALGKIIDIVSFDSKYNILNVLYAI